jgi:hypothetical protein
MASLIFEYCRDTEGVTLSKDRCMPHMFGDVGHDLLDVL